MRSRLPVRGFTIVELLIVIVVIGILATIGIVAYSGMQKRASETAMLSDLENASAIMEKAAIESPEGLFPNNVPDVVIKSPDVSLTAVSSDGIYYWGLSEVQNGVLFKKMCDDLVAEGYGVGTNNAGTTERYISGCNVYNKDRLQVNSSWNGRDAVIPVSSSHLPNVVASINYNDSWRPGRDAVEKKFYQEWNDRFLRLGGRYPVTIFWDGTWCKPGQSWCTAYDPLPTPSSTDRGKGYCIEATNMKYPDLHWYLDSETTTATQGRC